MLFGEIDDCEICPIRAEGLCNAGAFNPSSQAAYEPICDGFSPDEDTDDIIARIYAEHRRYDEAEDMRIQRERERNAKQKLAQERRREAAWHVRVETREISRLRKRIAANEAAVRLAESFAFAFNTNNAMFRYPERLEKRGTTKLDTENEGLRARIAELETVKRAKLAELRKARRA